MFHLHRASEDIETIDMNLPINDVVDRFIPSDDMDVVSIHDSSVDIRVSQETMDKVERSTTLRVNNLFYALFTIVLVSLLFGSVNARGIKKSYHALTPDFSENIARVGDMNVPVGIPFTSAKSEQQMELTDLNKRYRLMQNKRLFQPFVIAKYSQTHENVCYMSSGITWRVDVDKNSATLENFNADTFFSRLSECGRDPAVQFIIAPLTLRNNKSKMGHANMLLYNKEKKTLERFDPNGPVRYLKAMEDVYGYSEGNRYEDDEGADIDDGREYEDDDISYNSSDGTDDDAYADITGQMVGKREKIYARHTRQGYGKEQPPLGTTGAKKDAYAIRTLHRTLSAYAEKRGIRFETHKAAPVQMMEGYLGKFNFGGMCEMWTLWFLSLRMNNPQLSIDELNEKVIKILYDDPHIILRYLNEHVSAFEDYFAVDLADETSLRKLHLKKIKDARLSHIEDVLDNFTDLYRTSYSIYNTIMGERVNNMYSITDNSEREENLSLDYYLYYTEIRHKVEKELGIQLPKKERLL